MSVFSLETLKRESTPIDLVIMDYTSFKIILNCYFRFNRRKVFTIGPEAYIQPSIGESDNLIVNLEDIVIEEKIIFKVQELVKKKASMGKIIKEWWELAEHSSVNEMQLFFEGDDSQKIIRCQQIIVILVIGYLEVMDTSLYSNIKSISSISNIMSFMHKSYLIFVEFICAHLNDQQREKTQQWVDALYNILNERPAAKTYYD